ncbi:MAG: hypothetical protein FD180_3096 [Planctomycetota bacterium]|nr:MAG: hypothetical protein FD180_3096 [Planctomycetota bacterium]
MKPALAAVAISLAVAVFAAISLSREAKRREELEKRVATMEEARAGAVPKEPPETKAPGTRETPVAPPAPGQPSGAPSPDPRLRKLEEQVARLEDRVRELNRAAEGAAIEEVAGLPAEQLWQKAQMALQDRLTGKSDALLREFLKRFPTDPHASEALLSLGGNQLRVGDMAAAAGFYDRVLQEFPDSKQVPYAEFYLAMSVIGTDLNAGKGHYERAVEKFAGNPYWQAAALLNLSSAYSEKGQPEVAKEYLKKVTTQFAGNEQAAPLVKEAEDALKAMEAR